MYLLTLVALSSLISRIAAAPQQCISREWLDQNPSVPKGDLPYCNSGNQDEVAQPVAGQENNTPAKKEAAPAVSSSQPASPQTSPLLPGAAGSTSGNGAGDTSSGSESCAGGDVPQLSSGGCKAGFLNTVFNVDVPESVWNTIRSHGVSNFSTLLSVRLLARFTPSR